MRVVLVKRTKWALDSALNLLFISLRQCEQLVVCATLISISQTMKFSIAQHRAGKNFITIHKLPVHSGQWYIATVRTSRRYTCLAPTTRLGRLGHQFAIIEDQLSLCKCEPICVSLLTLISYCVKCCIWVFKPQGNNDEIGVKKQKPLSSARDRTQSVRLHEGSQPKALLFVADMHQACRPWHWTRTLTANCAGDPGSVLSVFRAQLCAYRCV